MEVGVGVVVNAGLCSYDEGFIGRSHNVRVEIQQMTLPKALKQRSTLETLMRSEDDDDEPKQRACNDDEEQWSSTRRGSTLRLCTDRQSTQ